MKVRIGLMIAGGAVILVFLAGLLLPGCFSIMYGGGPFGISPDMVEDANVICTGHFGGWQPFRWAVGNDPRQKRVTFRVDHYFQGSGPDKIELTLFQPKLMESVSRVYPDRMMPLKDQLLVVLQKDENGYHLAAPTSWLVVPWNAAKELSDASTESALEAVCLASLAWWADDSFQPAWSVLLSIPLHAGNFRPGSRSSDIYSRHDPVSGNVLATVANFQWHDPEMIALLKRVIALRGDPFRREALRALLQCDFATGWRTAFIFCQLNPHDPSETRMLISSITADTLPLVPSADLRALLNGEDEEVRCQVARAFGSMKSTSGLPWLAQCLESPDRETQYAAMVALYETIHGQFPEFTCPREDLFKQAPDKYLALYKDWLAQHGYSPAAAATSP